MREHRRLAASIAASVLGLLLCQVLLFALIITIYRIRPMTARGYFIVLGVSHLALIAFLYYRRADFYLVHDRSPLTRMNLPNLLTLIRISSTPTILYLLILSGEYDVVPAMIVFTAAVFLTDLFDGRISRRRAQITKIGQYLDSMSDYAVLGAISIAFLYHGLISEWFFIVFVARFGMQGVGMGVLLIYHGSVNPKSTWWGKASVAAVMVLLAISLLELVPSMSMRAAAATRVLEIPATVILALSAVEKAIILIGAFTAAKQRRAQSSDERTSITEKL